jgi:PmbA protein
MSKMPNLDKITTENELNYLEDIIKNAVKAGADSADLVYFTGDAESVSWRMGSLEDVERSENSDLGLRVMIGKKSAIVSSSDMSRDAISALTLRAIDMAKNAPEDPYVGLADENLLSMTDRPKLDLNDTHPLSSNQLQELARATEEIALEANGITNSEGAGTSISHSRIALLNSNGFLGTYESSNYSLSISLIAGKELNMERDYAWDSKRHFSDLDSPEKIAREATAKTLKKLNPRKVKTCETPVIFDPRVSNSLLGHLASAINGAAIARGTSFLLEMMGKQVFSDHINISDNPHIIRGSSSRPFDGEGVRNGKLEMIKEGRLVNWTLDSASAAQLNLTTNGRASRGTSTPPSPATTNFYMENGTISPEDMIKDIKSGLYVTDLIGMGVNGITGDYSRGASGFWIENGEIAYPVNEITIASNLKEIYMSLICANDLIHRYGTDAPTILIPNMMLAGS